MQIKMKNINKILPICQKEVSILAVTANLSVNLSYFVTTTHKSSHYHNIFFVIFEHFTQFGTVFVLYYSLLINSIAL